MDATNKKNFFQHFSHATIHVSVGNQHTVSPIWMGVDRPNVGGWSTGKNLLLAERLQKAVIAGAVFTRVEKMTDVNGKTYINASTNVLGRRLNADLKKLGY